MEIETTEEGTILLKEVYNPILLKTNRGETLTICMRDSGFEINYQGTSIEAKEKYYQSNSH